MGEKAKPKLDIFRLLEAADHRDRQFYAGLTDEERQSFNPLVAMRWLSAVRDHNYTQQYVVLTNDCVNVDFWALRNHPELQWLLMTCVGNDRKNRHDWIPMVGKIKGSVVDTFLRRWHPSLNTLEMKILRQQFTTASFAEFVRDTGVDDTEAEEIMAAFHKER